MNLQKIITNKFALLIIIILFILGLILWEHVNGGVVTHYLLADENLPGISNWWGLITIPLLSLLCLSLIQKRIKKATSNIDIPLNKIMYRFLGAVVLGLLISMLWEFRMEELLPFLMFLPAIIALFIPLHYPECVLGFVLASVYTFGGVLPIGFVIFLLITAFIAHKLIRGGILFIFSKLKKSAS